MLNTEQNAAIPFDMCTFVTIFIAIKVRRALQYKNSYVVGLIYEGEKVESKVIGMFLSRVIRGDLFSIEMSFAVQK